MNNDDRVNESLSALADGECDELERVRILKTLRGSAELRKRWEGMHAMRAVMRGENGGLLSADFADNVSRAIDEEAHVLVPERTDDGTRVARNWRKPVAGLAIAASVAVVSIFGLQTLQNQTPGSQPMAVSYTHLTLPTICSV